MFVFDTNKHYYYNSLAKLNEDWEDVSEDPEDKDFWFFDEEGIIINTKERNWPKESVTAAKAIGNYFETQEEAKKAVEKLKALKRLKDKGFKFAGYGGYHWTGDIWPHIAFSYPNFDDLFKDSETVADLDILFGVKE